MPQFDTDDLAAFFDAASFGETATYQPVAGGSLTVTVILRRQKDRIQMGESVLLADMNTAQVRASEVAAVNDGDQIVVGGVTYLVRGGRLADASGQIWTLDLERQS